MADFVTRTTVVTRQPVIKVEPGLKPGVYEFEMTAVTEDGENLPPVKVRVLIVEPDGNDRLTRTDVEDRLRREPLRPVDPRRRG